MDPFISSDRDEVGSNPFRESNTVELTSARKFCLVGSQHMTRTKSNIHTRN